jgi:deoxyribodipyrimidine photolyase
MVKPRDAEKTVKFIDEYCKVYRDLFPEVRSYEYFKYLHLGLISEKKRKTFPAIAEVAGLENSQGIDYFIGKSEWSVEEVRKRRLRLWQEGKTGFPLVDANMRELAATGFMSNRGRQNVASFPTKNFGINWQMGAESG